jgi:hypothetical protein
MPTITGLIHYVGPPLRTPWKAPQHLPINADGSLSRTFRDALPKSQEAFTVDPRVAGQQELFCNFTRCGEAAGVAHWWRKSGTEAVTAYLPGVDADDEDIVEQALALKPYPISLHIWHQILNAERPIYANFLLTPQAGEDRLMATTADALAFSFFSFLETT